MQRILLLSDIHGNFPALQAVADQADVKSCDLIINGGDCTVYAPFANQVMEWLHTHDVLSIRGNTDDKVLKLLRNKTFTKPKDPAKRVMYTHTAQELTLENRLRLQRLKKKEKIKTAGWKIALFHGSPAKHTEFLFATTPDARFAELAEKTAADIIVTGHSHTPYSKTISSKHFINPGSVGRMFDGSPMASYAIVILEKNNIEVTLHRCGYPVEDVVAALATAKLPKIYAAMYRQGRKLN